MYLIKEEKLKLQRKKEKTSKTSDLVNHHILGYNPSMSYYRQSHARNRLHISPGHDTSAMFKDFCSRYENVKISSTYYYKKVKQK